jgi:hypothetical protein
MKYEDLKKGMILISSEYFRCLYILTKKNSWGNWEATMLREGGNARYSDNSFHDEDYRREKMKLIGE